MSDLFLLLLLDFTRGTSATSSHYLGKYRRSCALLITRSYVFCKCPILEYAAVSIFTTQTWRGPGTSCPGTVHISVQLLPVVKYYMCFAAEDYRKPF